MHLPMQVNLFQRTVFLPRQEAFIPLARAWISLRKTPEKFWLFADRSGSW